MARLAALDRKQVRNGEVTQPKLHECQQNGLHGDSVVAPRGLHELFALCGASLAKTTRAAQEASDRFTFLREVIEMLLDERRRNASATQVSAGFQALSQSRGE